MVPAGHVILTNKCCLSYALQQLACAPDLKDGFARLIDPLVYIARLLIDDFWGPSSEFDSGSGPLVQVGAEYLILPKSLDYTPTSTTQILANIRAPTHCPLRVDFGGGWLDVPKHARPGAYVVNCAISPLVSLNNWPYQLCGGLGGSGAHALLSGKDALQSELDLGVGW
jgi:hypothetical protein